MEAYHHIATHSKSLESVYHARQSVVPDNTGPWSILHMPAEPHPLVEGFPLIDGLEDWQSRDLFATVVFPYLLLAFQGTGALWYQILPQGADSLTLKIHLMLPPQSMECDKADQYLDEMTAVVSAVHHEDIAANDLVWRGLTAPLTRQGRLSVYEKSIWQLNQWWLDQMESGANGT